MKDVYNYLQKSLLVCTLIIFISGCVDSGKADKPPDVSKTNSGIQAGYIKTGSYPDISAMLPPPPAPGSSAFALDEEVNRKCLTLRDTLRWKLAAMDADTNFPDAAGIFSCALNAPVTERETPRLYTLLRRICFDERQTNKKVKSKYMRTRPFTLNGEPTCKQEDEKFLKNNGSYPSGHASLGWAWALVLSEISPDNADAILARGRAFGESRVICNVHWYSDVVEGYLVGSAIVARLHTNPEFRNDVEAARAELAIVRAKGLKPARDCKLETEALNRLP